MQDKGGNRVVVVYLFVCFCIVGRTCRFVVVVLHIFLQDLICCDLL